MFSSKSSIKTVCIDAIYTGNICAMEKLTFVLMVRWIGFTHLLFCLCIRAIQLWVLYSLYPDNVSVVITLGHGLVESN